ncbi:30S ribosomal protein S6 [Candidatus Saccharibacteria bacterium]|nr:30S ribosomal protein S6 [Candidatus Saccharibacteria bacterium]
MKDYELTVLFHPDLEMNLDPAVDKVKKIITSADGKIINEENDGKKRLSYKIDGQEFAVFYYLDVQLPAEAPAKISSTLNITDEVIRYLLVRADNMHAKAAEADSEESNAPAKETKSTEEKGE